MPTTTQHGSIRISTRWQLRGALLVGVVAAARSSRRRRGLVVVRFIDRSDHPSGSGGRVAQIEPKEEDQ